MRTTLTTCIERLIEQIEEMRFRYSVGDLSPAEFTKELDKNLEQAYKDCLIDEERIYVEGWNDCLTELLEVAQTIQK
jgi:hypothetical protein